MIQKNNEERGMEYGENDGGREEERDQGKWKMEGGNWASLRQLHLEISQGVSQSVDQPVNK